MSDPRKVLVFVCLAALCIFICSQPAAGKAPENTSPRQIGSRLELFVDDWLIDKMTGGLSLKLHSPRPTEVVLRFDKPWEGRWSYYVSVFQDDDRYRMYYRAGYIQKGLADDATWQAIGYAESTDGINWTKPELGLFDFKGSKKNNIVWKGVGVHCGFGVFKDTNPNCKPNERYKALSSNGYKKPVYAFGSPDGIRWHLIQKEPVINEFDGATAAYDSHFCTRWDPTTKRYVVYHRIWYRAGAVIKETPCVAKLRKQPFFTSDYRELTNLGKVRSVAIRTSKDFIHWTSLRRLNFGDTPPEHLYTNAITPYYRAPHILLGFPNRFWARRRRLPEAHADGISDTVFISSRDGYHFDRRFIESFIRPGRERLSWMSRSNMVAPGIIQTAPDELSIYACKRFADPSQHVQRYVLRTDGFVSVNAKYSVGEMLTKPFTFKGKELVINYATSAAGFIAVEIQDASGKPFPDFALPEGSFTVGLHKEPKDSPQIYGDEIEHVVTWTNGSDVSALAGKVVRLRFVMKDADLYSIQFRP